MHVYLNVYMYVFMCVLTVSTKFNIPLELEYLFVCFVCLHPHDDS